MNISIANKWNATAKYMDIIPGETLKISFDFDKGTMGNPYLFILERINGVWEPQANRDVFALQTGHFEVELMLTGDHVLLYFEKGNSTDDGTLTSCSVDNFSVSQTQLETIEENNYYPFGLKHKGYNNVSTSSNIALKRMFGGKEYQDELGLEWYDVSARNYDPALGRWMNLDPLAETMPTYSPYTYAFNNPIYFLDPDGAKPCPSGDCGGAVIAVFYHGGFTGGGKTTTASQAGGTGKIYGNTQTYTSGQGRDFKGTIIAPGVTSASGVDTGLAFIKENYSAGDQVIIYGYSYGVDVAVDLSEQLNELGIDVDLLVTVDGSDGPLQNTTVNTDIPENVHTNLNVFQDSDSGTSNASSGSSSSVVGSSSSGPIGSSSGASSGSSSGTSSGSSASSSPTSNSPGSNGGPNSAVSPKTNVVNRNVSGSGINHGNIQQKAEKTINNYIQSYIRTYKN